MSYTRPSASAADATFQGASAYTRPSAGTADAVFPSAYADIAVDLAGALVASFGSHIGVFDQIQPLSGSTVASFGAHNIAITVLASGEVITRYGEHSASIVYVLTGESLLVFGQHRIYPYYHAPGEVLTKYGGHSAAQYWRLGSGPVLTKYGQLYTATNRTGKLSGILVTRFGTHFAYRDFDYSINRKVSLAGEKVARFGTHSAVFGQIGQANGAAVSLFGMHVAVSIANASGASMTQYGAGLAIMTQPMAGSKVTQFGILDSTLEDLPENMTRQMTGARLIQYGRLSNTRTQSLSGKALPKFGVHEGANSWAWKMRPWAVISRFGRHAGRTFFAYPMIGLQLTQFGSNTASQTHLMVGAGAVTKYGRHIVRRVSQC